MVRTCQLVAFRGHLSRLPLPIPSPLPGITVSDGWNYVGSLDMTLYNLLLPVGICLLGFCSWRWGEPCVWGLDRVFRIQAFD